MFLLKFKYKCFLHKITKKGPMFSDMSIFNFRLYNTNFLTSEMSKGSNLGGINLFSLTTNENILILTNSDYEEKKNKCQL